MLSRKPIVLYTVLRANEQQTGIGNMRAKVTERWTSVTTVVACQATFRAESVVFPNFKLQRSKTY
jgi:hypothetical protein